MKYRIQERGGRFRVQTKSWWPWWTTLLSHDFHGVPRMFGSLRDAQVWVRSDQAEREMKARPWRTVESVSGDKTESH